MSADRRHVLKVIRKYLKPDQRIFVGVIAPSDPHIETPEEVRDRVLEASEYIPIEQLGTTDDCGFSPFMDNTSTSRDTAFAKIQARVLGTALAAKRHRSSPVTTKDDEDELLRSAALQTANSILIARQRAEQRSEAYLAEAQRLSHTGSFGWRVSTGEILWSEETFRIFQYDPTTTPTVELVLQRVHPEDAALVTTDDRARVAGWEGF